MHRRSNFEKPSLINLQGVLGNFNVPKSDLAVEYVLTYASLDRGNTANGQLLDLLVPVREIFTLQDLDFDHLLQRDLDDFRVSEEMVPYLLGDDSSGPRFFPPIVAVIVPMVGKKMDEFYPLCNVETEDVTTKSEKYTLQVFNYGNIFSVKREKEKDQLAHSPVDLCINATKAKLVIVDGQHRAMAMLAAYRSALDKWNENEFKHFYKQVKTDLSDLQEIHLPVCIVYFPELTQDPEIIQNDSITAKMNLTSACRKFFLDVNRNARHPSDARQILLNDTDLVACFTRHIFNMVQKNTKPHTLQLKHAEYDNPHNRVRIFRPFALTDVYTIFNIIRTVLLADDDYVSDPIKSSSSGRRVPNNSRLQRELNLLNVLTESDKEKFETEVSDIKQDNYPRGAEEILRRCFEKTWGGVIVNSLSKLHPFSIHIQAVDTVLKELGDPIGIDRFACTALVEGQGLRHTLERRRDEDVKHRLDRDSNGGNEKSDAEKTWDVLRAIEEDFERRRCMLYLKLSKDPKTDELSRVNRVFDCFRSSAFQNGLFMAFAYLKYKLEIVDNSEFSEYIDRWINRINKKFQSLIGVRIILFDRLESNSLRHIYKPTGGLNPSDWPFFRYLILELLSVTRGRESKIINEAIIGNEETIGWRGKLYRTLYKEKKKALKLDENEEDNQDQLDILCFSEIVGAYKGSLEIEKKDIELSLSKIREGITQSTSVIDEDDDLDETDESDESFEDQ